jgi:hypothetical protein
MGRILTLPPYLYSTNSIMAVYSESPSERRSDLAGLPSTNLPSRHSTSNDGFESQKESGQSSDRKRRKDEED